MIARADSSETIVMNAWADINISSNNSSRDIDSVAASNYGNI